MSGFIAGSVIGAFFLPEFGYFGKFVSGLFALPFAPLSYPFVLFSGYPELYSHFLPSLIAGGILMAVSTGLWIYKRRIAYDICLFSASFLLGLPCAHFYMITALST